MALETIYQGSQLVLLIGIFHRMGSLRGDFRGMKRQVETMRERIKRLEAEV